MSVNEWRWTDQFNLAASSTTRSGAGEWRRWGHSIFGHVGAREAQLGRRSWGHSDMDPLLDAVNKDADGPNSVESQSADGHA